MATGTKAPASKTLNYELSGDTLDRVQRAGQEIRPKENVTEVIQDVGEDIFKVGQEKQQFEQLSGIAWDAAFNAQGERGDWVSPELYDQFQASEAKFKEAYLEAVQSGDKALVATLLQKQGNRATSLQGWKEVMKEAKQIDDTHGWGVLMTEDPENMVIMSALSNNDGSAVMRIDDSGSMVFDIKIPPDNKVRTVTKSEIDKIVANGIKPLEREAAWFEGLDQIQQDGMSGLPWDKGYEARLAKANLNQINVDNIGSYMDEPFTGYDSFATEFLASTEFSSPNVQSKLPVTADIDVDGDGEISANEQDLDMTLKENILEYFRTTEGYEMARTELAAWMTAKQKEKHSSGLGALQMQIDAAKYNKKK